MAAATANPKDNSNMGNADAEPPKTTTAANRGKTTAEQAKTAAADRAKATAEQVNAERVKAKTNAEVKATAERAKTAAEQADREASRRAQEDAGRLEDTFGLYEENAERVNKIAEEATRRFQENAERANQMTQESAERVQALNSAMMDSSKAGSRVAVDTYAQVAKNVFAVQRQMIGDTPIRWVRDAATTQIQFAEDVTSAWVKAARQLLK